MMYDDIFVLLDEKVASDLRNALSEKDAVDFANRYRPQNPLSFFGDNRKMRLYRKLGLIEKAPGQEKKLVSQAEFVFSKTGYRIAEQLRKAHDARVEHLIRRRAEISVLLGQLKRAGKKDDSDLVLKTFGVKRRHVHDIKTCDLEEIYLELIAI